MSKFETLVQVSDKAMRLIQSGEAFFGPGGVRMKNGQLVELYKLLSPEMLNKGPMVMPISPVSIATQAADIVTQSANIVLSYKNGLKLNRVINMLSSLQGIAWASTAIGAANIALTAMSFSVINSKLDGLSQQIAYAVEDLKREMKAIQMEEKSIEILTLIGNLKSTAHYLSINSVSRQDEIQVENYLNGARQLIIWLKEHFEKANPSESGTIFTLLFDLTSIYTAVLKEYCSQYYYLENCFPGNFPVWIEAYDYAGSKLLQGNLKRTIWMANPLETTEKIASSYDFTLNTVRLQQQELENTKKVIPLVPQEVITDFDAYVKKCIESGNVEIVEQAQDEDPRERVLLIKNGFEAA